MHNSHDHHMDMDMKMYFSESSFSIQVSNILFKQWSIGPSNVTIYVSSTFLIFAMAFINQLLYFLLHVHSTKKFYQYILMVVKPLLFLFNISIGYLIMLVLMTYNFGLVMAIIGGNFLGYIIFSIIIQDCLMGKRTRSKVHSSNGGGDQGGSFIAYQQQNDEDDQGRTSGHNFFDDEYDDLDGAHPNGDLFDHFGGFVEDSFSSTGAINKW